MRVLGAIIAGGASRRMGEAKALMAWRGKPLIAHVAERLAPQTQGLVLNVNQAAAAYAFLGLAVVSDSRATATPLAGLHAVLAYAKARGFAAVLTCPCDTPLLPADLAERLAGSGPSVAMSLGQAHYLTGFWPVQLLDPLEQAMDAGTIRLMDWAALCKARRVAWAGPDPFININTPQDFLRLSDLP